MLPLRRGATHAVDLGNVLAPFAVSHGFGGETAAAILAFVVPQL